MHIRLGALNVKIHFIEELLCEHRNHDGARITRVPQPADHMVNLLLDLSEILEAPPYELNAERRAALAGHLFQNSIYAFRNGAPDAARRGFRRSRELSRHFDYHERRFYKYLAKVIGPFYVEQALSVARGTRAKVAFPQHKNM
ncbi:MAG: hypothetical protein EOO38_13365 [Cytophagaceae bacterium]|nr:MAG: hypothetical protein EOO38_13365 [Cytophagaceae bacterium]